MPSRARAFRFPDAEDRLLEETAERLGISYTEVVRRGLRALAAVDAPQTVEQRLADVETAIDRLTRVVARQEFRANSINLNGDLVWPPGWNAPGSPDRLTEDLPTR